MKPSRPYHSFTAYHREPGGLRRLDAFVEWTKAHAERVGRSPLRILDVGCGNGNLTLPLASLGHVTVGVDFDAASIAAARERAKDFTFATRFEVGSFEAAGDEPFDLIIASEVLEHQELPDVFIAEVKRRLTPDGAFLVSVPNGKRLEERVRRVTTHTELGKKIKTAIKRQVGDASVQSQAQHPHVQFFSWREWQRLFKRTGLRVIDARPAAALFKEFFYLGGRVVVKRGSPFFQSMDAADNWLADRTPLVWADGWLAVTYPCDPSKPYVIQVLPTLEPGGAEHLVLDLAEQLPARGFEVATISILRGGPLLPVFQKQNLPIQVADRRGFLGLDAIRAMRRRFALEQPDIVHTHLFGADVWGRIAARLARVPVVAMTEHSTNPDHGLAKRLVKRLLARVTDIHIAVSEEVKACMRERDGIDPRQIQIIRNGVDMEKIPGRGTRPFHAPAELICVARLVPNKGHALLLRALALVDRPWRLSVVGAGPELRPLQSLAESLKIAGRVRWLGYRDDVPQLLAASDLFVFASFWEGLGLAMIEAAAAGVPVVASDLASLREIVGADHARFVPPGDAAGFAVAVTQVLDDPAGALVRAATVEGTVRDRFSLERMLVGYDAAYRRALRMKNL